MAYLHALLPADPQITSGQETGHGMSGQVVDPALLPQLCHDSINPGEAGPTLCPLCQRLGVAVPGDLNADGVTLHLVEAGVVGGCCVEELAPQQLTVEREGGGAVLLHLVGVGEEGKQSDILVLQLRRDPVGDLYKNIFISCIQNHP